MRDRAIIARIAARCERRDDGCLIWTGAKLPKGYGQIRIARQTKQVHRVMWEGHHGAIPPGMFVLHSCDTPACCEITHLRVGSAAENSADMVAKGRQPCLRGELSGRAKLKTTDVESIRSMRRAGISCAVIGAQFGIHASHVSRVARGARWPTDGGEA